MNQVPYDLYALDCYGLAYHTLARFKQLLQRNMMIPADIVEQIEENIIPALEYIEGWEPTDAMIQDYVDSRGVF